MKKLIFLLILLFLFSVFPTNVKAENDEINEDQISEEVNEEENNEVEGVYLNEQQETVGETIQDDFEDNSQTLLKSNNLTNAPSLVGSAYAVLEDNGNLVFFRSNNNYNNKATGTFADINNNSYTGTIYKNVENTTTSSNYELLPWFKERMSIKSTSVAPNQTIKPTSMAYWYFGTDITTFDFSIFDTTNVTDTQSMFEGCRYLTSIDLSSLHTSNITKMNAMFKSCWTLKTIDVSNFDTSNVTNMRYMFNDCRAITSLDLSSFDTNNVTRMDMMFSNCNSLMEVTLGENFVWKDSPLPSGTWKKYSPEGITSYTETLLFNNWNSSLVGTWVKNGNAYAVLDDQGILTFFRSYDNYTNGTTGTFTDIFNNSYTGIIYTGFETASYTKTYGDKVNSPWFNDRCNITTVKVADNQTIIPLSMAYWFFYCENLISFNQAGFDTSNVTNMRWLFCQCYKLKSLDLSNFDTSNVTNMEAMFGSGIETLNIYNFDTSNVTYAFYFPSVLKQITIGPKFVWKYNQLLGTTNDVWEGCLEDGSKAYYTASSLKQNWTPSLAGIWTLLRSTHSYAVLDNNGNLVFFRSNNSYYGNGETGTFVDINNNSYTGTIYYYFDENGIYDSSNPTKNVPWYKDRKNIVTVSVADDQVIAPFHMDSWFKDCTNLKTIDFNGILTIRAKEMNNLFYSCVNLETINNLDTVDTTLVTTMQRLFYGCTKLTSLDLSSFNTSNVTTMNGMFDNCSSLTSINLGSEFEFKDDAYLPSGTWKRYAPEGVNSYSEVELYDNWATSLAGTWERKGNAYAVLDSQGNLTFFRSYNNYISGTIGTFSDITNNSYTGTIYAGIEELTGDFNSSNPTNTVPWYNERTNIIAVNVAANQEIAPISMNSWFRGCTNLSTVDFEGFNTTNTTDMSLLFYNCSNLETLNNLDTIDTSNVTSFKSTFRSCSKLTSLDLSSFNTTSLTDTSYMFNNDLLLRSLDISSFNTSNVSTMTNMFKNCNSLEIAKLGTNFLWKSNAYLPTGTWNKYSQESIISYSETELYTSWSSLLAGTWERNGEAYAVLDSQGNLTFFRGYDNYTNKEVGTFTDIKNNLYTGIVYTNFEKTSFTSEYNSNTNETYNTTPWYDERDNIVTVSVATNQTIKPISMAYWFAECSNLASFNQIGFDTNSVIDMAWMFYKCEELTSIDLSSFNTSNVTNMADMFCFCTSLTQINLSSFNTENVLYTDSMFANCTELETLNISNFDTSAVTNMDYMFGQCSSLKALDLSSFNTNNVLEMYSIFQGCNSLATIKLGSNFVWKNEAYLNEGYWLKDKTAYNETELYENWSTSLAGTWTYIGNRDTSFVEIYGKSLTLNGKIGVNFYLVRPDKLLADNTNPYVMINSKKIFFSDAVCGTVSGVSVCKFTYEIDAREMNVPLVLKVYDDNNNEARVINQVNDEIINSDNYTYTARTYLDNVSTSDLALYNMAVALADYGSFAQRYFKYNLDTYISPTDAIYTNKTETENNLVGYAKIVNGTLPEGLNLIGHTLTLKAETKITHYFTLDEGFDICDYIFEIDGQEVTPYQKGSYYCVSINDIPAKDLDTFYEVAVTDGIDDYSFNYSALSYCANAKNEADTDLANLKRAIYLYNQTANEYFE